jgi:hypothetical protein
LESLLYLILLFVVILFAKLSHARALIELVGGVPQSFDAKWEGADWEVVVRIKSTGYGPEKDFTEELPE